MSLLLRRRALMSVVNKVKNLFNYALLKFTPNSGSASGKVIKTSNSITFEAHTDTGAAYFNAKNILELKPNTTYTSKCKLTFVNRGSVNINGGGSMACSLLCQDNNSFTSNKVYIVNGYVSETGHGVKEGTYELYTKFTTPSDLTSYKYLVTRVTDHTDVTFENLILVEGDYTKDTFPL